MNIQKESHDRLPLEDYDVTPASGSCQEITDQSIDNALLNLSIIQSGGVIEPIREDKRKHLDKRIKEGIFEEVTPNSFDLPQDIDEIVESVPFQDDTTIDCPEHIQTEAESGEGVQIARVEETHTITSDDPTEWIVTALRTIHGDIQQLKPRLDIIPIVKERIDEIQGILGAITSGFIDMKNSMNNMEATITQNRINISKLTDLVKTMLMNKVLPTPTITPTPTAIPGDKFDNNIDVLIESLTKQKNLTSIQCTKIKHMLSLRDRESIEVILQDVGIIRPILGSEMDKLIQLDKGSSTSLRAALTVLLNLVVGEKTKTIPSQDLPKDNRTLLEPLGGQKKGVLNPFKIRQ